MLACSKCEHTLTNLALYIIFHLDCLTVSLIFSTAIQFSVAISHFVRFCSCVFLYYSSSTSWSGVFWTTQKFKKYILSSVIECDSAALPRPGVLEDCSFFVRVHLVPLLTHTVCLRHGTSSFSFHSCQLHHNYTLTLKQNN